MEAESSQDSHSYLSKCWMTLLKEMEKQMKEKGPK